MSRIPVMYGISSSGDEGCVGAGTEVEQSAAGREEEDSHPTNPTDSVI